MLELTDVHRERLRELRELADEAEGDGEGAREARRRLRLELRRSAPEVVRSASDIAGSYRGILAETASGGDALRKEATVERARLIAETLMGEDPTPLEALLSERVASLWVLVELQEALAAAWYSRSKSGRVSVSYQLQMVKLQESANRRYLQAIKTLAQVQRLRRPSRLQVNIGGRHVNVA